MSKNEKNHTQDQDIIDFYMNYQGDKKKAISELVDKYELSVQRIYQILKDNKCPTPREFEKQNKAEIPAEDKHDIETETTITIADKLRDYGFKDEAEIERRVNMVKSIQKITGIDVCNEFEKYLVFLIESIESNQL